MLLNCLRFDFKSGVFTIALLLFWSGIISAQSTYTASGTITDKESGKILIGADIIVKETDKGAATNQDGYFVISGLEAGEYTLIFSYVGFLTVEEKITVPSNQNVDVQLSQDATMIEEVVVHAKSKARELKESALPISVITIKDIPGTVSDVNELLSKTSGVKLRQTGGTGSASRISIRGLEGKRIGYFINETPMNDNSEFLDLNDIPLDLIERIEIYKGVVPAKLGGSAVGGAVNIVVREFPSTYVDLNYSVASFNTHKASSVLKTNKNGYEFGIGGFYTYSDNDYEMELPLQKGTFVKRDHDRFEKITIGGNITSKRWWFDEVEIEPAVTFTKKQIQGIEYNIQEAESFADAYILVNHAEKDNFLTPGLDLDLSLIYAHTTFRFEDKAKQRYNWDGSTYPAISRQGGEIDPQPNDSRNIKHVVINKVNLNYLLNDWSSLNLNSTINAARGLPEDRLKDEVIGYQTNFDSRLNSWVLGLNYEMRLFENKFVNSLTAKYYNYSMDTKIIDIFGSTQVEDVDLKKQNFGVSNALRYAFTPRLMAKASISYDVRLPTDEELLGNGFIISPSPDLEPERNAGVNFGLLYDKALDTDRRLQIEGNLFYNHLENMIRFTGGFLRNNYRNFGQMRTLGADFEIKWDATKYLYLYSNATYQDLRDTRKYQPGSNVENPTKGDRIPNVPYFYANAGLELHKENIFGGSGQSSRFFTSAAFIEEYFYDFEQSKFQERRLPRSLSIDAGIEHSFQNQKIIIGFQANNITNTTILSEFNRPLPGRNFAFKIKYRYK